MAGRTVRHTKRYIAADVALLLTLTVSATALADNGRSAGTPGRTAPAERAGAPAAEQSGSFGHRGGSAERADQQGTQRGVDSANIDKIEAAIAALTDEPKRQKQASPRCGNI